MRNRRFVRAATRVLSEETVGRFRQLRAHGFFTREDSNACSSMRGECVSCSVVFRRVGFNFSLKRESIFNELCFNGI